MQTTKQLLDRAKKAQGIESDYKLAQVLGVVQSAVTHWRSGRSSPDDVIAARLAEMAGQDPLSVIAELHAARAKTPDAKQLWMRMAMQLRHAVAGVMFAVGAAMLLIAGSPTSAEASTGTAQSQSAPGLCIMLNVKREVADDNVAKSANSLRSCRTTCAAPVTACLAEGVTCSVAICAA